MVRVKICGITTIEDARQAVAAGADWIGLNFYPASPRSVDPDRAREIVTVLGKRVQIVGVFVNASRSEVQEIVESVGLDLLQFHGDESPSYCSGWPRPVIKALRMRGREDLDRAQAYRVDYLLVDAHASGHYGGTGKTVDWALVGAWKPPAKLILAGGLDPDNVAEAVRIVRPFGVDVASGVERRPGQKDPVKMRRFIENAKAA
ncbi:MAG: N-(5'-phosphoribosyl)anthranilate isomerase [Candidatus Binatia bacterium]|nr:MAG: N-(5'-phosphoribosyl)anthranilate isomerase [Candidatus Binatia bacterium]